MGDGRFLDTPNKQGNGYGLYSSSHTDRYHGYHGYHPYSRSDRGYFLNEFKKYKPPTFYGETQKSRDVEVWLLGVISKLDPERLMIR